MRAGSLYRCLELGVMEPLPVGNTRITITPPRPLKSAEEVERELSGFNEDFWEASRLRKRGKSIEKIHKHFSGKYSMPEIGYMIEKILNVNLALTSRDSEVLRQQMVDELMDLEDQIYQAAELDNSGILTDKQIRLILDIKKQVTDLQGIKAPVKVEVNQHTTVEDARERLEEKYERYKAARMNVVDVTPILPESGVVDSVGVPESASMPESSE